MPVTPSARWAGRAALALAVGLLAVCSQAQQVPTLLIISRPEPGKSDFVDVSYYLVPALNESGQAQGIAYKSSLPVVRTALDEKRLTQADLAEPLSKASAHRIARALSATHVLYVSAHFLREGLSASAELEAAGPAEAWNSILTTRLQPYRESGKKRSLAEGIHVQVAVLVDQVTAALQGRTVTGGTQGVRNLGPIKPVKPDRDSTAKPPTGSEPPKRTDGPPPLETVKDPSVSAPPPTAPTVDANAPTSYETQIERARRDGDQAALIVALRRAINERPKDARLRRELVEAYRERGLADAARDEVQRAVEVNPEDAGLRRLVADGLADAGDAAGAVKQYEEAARLAPKDAEIIVALGDAYWNAARPDDAARTYAAAAQADAKSPLPHRRLARVYLQKGRYSDCVTEAGLALKLSPADDPLMAADYGQLLVHSESSLTDVLAKMQTVRKGVLDGTITRETAFQQVTEAKKRADDLGAFLEALPAGAFTRVQASYSQAAGLVVQAAEATLEYLESRNTDRDEEATRRRVEASRGLEEGNRRLKALLGKPPTK